MFVDPVRLGQSISLLDELYSRFQSDPASVGPEWREFFLNGQAPEPIAELARAAALPAPALPARSPAAATLDLPAAPAPAREAAAQPEHPFGIWPLVDGYRSLGHQAANLDPLGLIQPRDAPELDPAHHGFSESDLDREFPTGGLFGASAARLRDIVDRLRRTYCGSIGVESSQIQNER
ncbi:MAG TPA: hypothetical protein VEL05_06305, partial [Candidatus Acidoferrum sp.]|nr:hypothetical protein [Candidatus Acidoferrum sp.]